MVRHVRGLLILGLHLLSAFGSAFGGAFGGGGVARGDELRVAVMEFTNASGGGELDSLGKGLQSMLTTDLAQISAFKLVERQRLQDIQAELKLGRSKAIDKTTAAKIGKLAGATHLFSGSFTVVGSKMRIDGRLVAVASGEVLLAADIEGEKDLFFELEKTLVQKVVAAAGVKVQPKEKAAIGKVHTADFGAFKKFSDGVSAFDDKRYDEALRALDEATQIDKDFTLASLTLEEYERIASKVRAKADAAGTAAEAMERMEKQKALKGQQALAQRLWQMVEKKGGGQAQKERLAATCLLAFLYWDAFNVNTPGLDKFSLERMGDSLARRYYTEAVESYPLAPPLCSRRYYSGSRLDLSNDNFDEQLKNHVEALATYVTSDNQMTRAAFLNEMRTEVMWFAGHLQLDGRELLRLFEQYYQLAGKHKLTDEEKREFEEQIADHARKLLLLDKSTQTYVALSNRSKDESKLRDYAQEIEQNKRVTAAVLGKGTHPLAREHWVLDHFMRVEMIENLYGKGLSKNALEELEGARRMDGYNYRARHWLLGSLPMWHAVTEERGLYSGARKDPLRAEDLRWYSTDAKADEVDVLEGRSRPAFVLKAKLDARPAEDFYIRQGAPRPAMAQVGVAFALKDIEVTDPDHADSPPLRGLAVLVGPRGAQLVELVSDKRRETVEVKVKEEQKLPLPLDRKVDLVVSVDKGRVEVTVDSTKLTFKAPAETDGFYGLIFRGAGYVAVEGVSIK